MAEQEKRGLGSSDEKTREEVARKGGEAVSRDREHMAQIGRKGGESRQSAARLEKQNAAMRAKSEQQADPGNQQKSTGTDNS